MNLTIYSDGGGTKDNAAAGACILSTADNLEYKFIVFLGEATNNEAEISAGLIGFAALNADVLSLEPVKEITWVSDSDYTLKSATSYIFNWQRNGWQTAQKKPVKNQGLFKAYLELSEQIKVNPQHVKGHAGHRENELCDQASTFAQASAAEILNFKESTYLENMPGLEDNWYLLDGREFLKELREENISGGLNLLKEQFLNLFKGAKAEGSIKEKEEISLSKFTKELEKQLKGVFDEAPEDPKLESLRDELLKVLKEYKD